MSLKKNFRGYELSKKRVSDDFYRCLVADIRKDSMVHDALSFLVEFYSVSSVCVVFNVFPAVPVIPDVFIGKPFAIETFTGANFRRVFTVFPDIHAGFVFI